MKGKGVKIQVISTKKESRVITTGPTTLKGKREYYQLHSHGFHLLDEMKTIPRKM